MPSIEVHLDDGGMHTIAESVLDADYSQHIFRRDGVVRHLVVGLVSA